MSTSGEPAYGGPSYGGPVFDVHVHIQPPEQFKPHMRPLVDPGDAAALEALRSPSALLRLMDEAGVEKVGMIQYVAPELMGFDAALLDYGLDFARHAPDRLVPFAGVHPRHCTHPGDEVERLYERGARALKFHPPHQLFAVNAYLDALPTLAQAYERAQALAMPITIHTGTSVFPGARNRFADPMPVDDVAVDFPDLKLILAHAGRPLYMDTAFFLARRHPNVYLELSGIPPKKMLDYLPRLPQIADKVLWGTDWPSPGVRELGKNLGAFRQLGLGEDVERRILWDNAVRVFG